MRLLLLGSLLALLLAVPAATAQLTPPWLTVDAVAVSSSPLDPGNSTAVEVTYTRTCPHAGGVYSEQAAVVGVQPRANWTVQGPGEVLFPQQVCADSMTASVVVTYVVTAPRDAERGETFSFIATGRLAANNQVTPPSNEAQYPFAIATTEAPPVQPAVEEAVKESPSAAAGLLALGLAGAVLLARRR